jgi:hypothetical protein
MKKFVFFGLMGLLFFVQNSFAQNKGINVSVDIYISENTNDCHVCKNNGSYAFTCETNGCGHDGFVCSEKHNMLMCKYHYNKTLQKYDVNENQLTKTSKEVVFVPAPVEKVIVHTCVNTCNHNGNYNNNSTRVRFYYNEFGYAGNGWGRQVASPYYGPSRNTNCVSVRGFDNQPWKNVNTRNATNRPRPTRGR